MVSLDTISSGHRYVKTMKVLQFNKIGKAVYWFGP